MTEPERSIWAARCDDTTPRDRRNQLRFLLACAVWGATFVVVTHLARQARLPGGALGWVVVALPTIAAVVAAVAYARFLEHADELQRMIQLRALALGFGAAWIAICGYPLFETLGAPPAEADDYYLVMIIAFVIGNLLGRRRYR